MITLKTPQQIEKIRRAAKILKETFLHLQPFIKPGISTKKLDTLAADFIRGQGAEPSFFGYNGFPASVCTSVNEVVIHGIPSAKEILKEGAVLSLDIGVCYAGFFADAARSYPIGQPESKVGKLLEVTEKSLLEGINAVTVKGRIKDIAKAVSGYIKPFNYGIVDSYCGHGVGLAVHEEPPILNVYTPHGGNPRIRNGMVLAIEPMVCLGSGAVKTAADNFTVVSCDGSVAAHFEHTIAVIDGQAEILT